MYLKILEILSVESKGLSMGFSPMYSLPRLFPTVRAQNYSEHPLKFPKSADSAVFLEFRSRFVP